MYKYQFGFRKGYSTELAILEITDSLKKAMDKKLVTCGLFLDFSKAFDTINHDILLSKLYSYGIRGNPLRWFESYLYNRNQVVKIGDTISSSQTIICGIYLRGQLWGHCYFCSILMIYQTVQANYPFESLLMTLICFIQVITCVT